MRVAERLNMLWPIPWVRRGLKGRTTHGALHSPGMVIGDTRSEKRRSDNALLSSVTRCSARGKN